MMSDPVTPGPDLLSRLGELTAAVDGLSARVANETAATDRKFTTARKAARLALAAVAAAVAVAVLGALVSAVLFLRLQNEVDKREDARINDAVVSCLNGNASRAAVVEGDLLGGDQFADVLGRITARPEDTPEVVERRASQVAALRAQFRTEYMANMPAALGPRDCSPEAVSTPTTLAPGR